MCQVTVKTASKRSKRTGNDNVLLTPGPLTTSLSVKQAMLRDWGSRDPAFIALNADIRRRLLAIAIATGDTDGFVCVPVQGSGTFAIEATLGTLVPREGKLLVLVNGAYGERMVKIMQRLGRSVTALTCAENATHDLGEVKSTLQGDPAITHVAAVHCETTSGILNPIEQIAEKVYAEGRAFIVDAMSSFGALPLDAVALNAAAVVASSNKCLEGVPGMGFAIIRKDVLDDWLGAGKAEVICPITDPYVVHHGALGSFVTVYLESDVDSEALVDRLSSLDGIDTVLGRAEAAAALELPGDRIGDLVVTSTRHVVIGAAEAAHDLSRLDAPLRSHGGFTEQTVPFMVNKPVIGLGNKRKLRNYDAFDVALNHVEVRT